MRAIRIIMYLILAWALLALAGVSAFWMLKELWI
jgi:hypothetical protein